MRIASGANSNCLARKISQKLQVELIEVELKKFNDGESFCVVNKSLKAENIYLISDISSNINNSIIETLLAIDALFRAGSKGVSLVIPYFAYSRQDKQIEENSSVAVEVIINLFFSTGIDALYTLDFHSETPIKNFPHKIVNLSSEEIFFHDIKKNRANEFVLVSPDFGRAKYVKELSNKLNCEFLLLDKKRNNGEIFNYFDAFVDISEKDCIIVDDIVDSGQTICNTIQLLKKLGARELFSYITHPVFSHANPDHIIGNGLKELVITDSVENTKIKMTNHTRSVTISGLIAKAIKENEESKYLNIAN